MSHQCTGAAPAQHASGPAEDAPRTRRPPGRARHPECGYHHPRRDNGGVPPGSDIRTFLSSIRAPSAVINELLAFMEESNATPAEAARNFLATEGDSWTFWLDDVDGAVLERVQNAVQ